jgi:glycosyltransferase involved in cell wall biosynthesis
MLRSVSVIIPSYNSKNTIVRAIDSALNQSIPPDEVIIVDDGSNDGTSLIDFSAIDLRIKFVAHSKNRGGSAARNTGIDMARGNWVALLDSDDIWLPNKLQRQFEALSLSMNSDKVFCSSNVLVRVEKKKDVLHNKMPPGERDLSEYFLIDGGTLQTSTLMLSAALARRVRFNENLARHQDWDFVIRLIHSGAELIYIHEPLVIYDANDGPDKVSSARRSIRPSLEWLKNADSHITPKARHHYYLSTCFRRHVREKPLVAVITLAAVTIAYPRSFGKTIAYCGGSLKIRISRRIRRLVSDG